MAEIPTPDFAVPYLRERERRGATTVSRTIDAFRPSHRLAGVVKTYEAPMPGQKGETGAASAVCYVK
jgi:hypothetical protein